MYSTYFPDIAKKAINLKHRQEAQNMCEILLKSDILPSDIKADLHILTCQINLSSGNIEACKKNLDDAITLIVPDLNDISYLYVLLLRAKLCFFHSRRISTGISYCKTILTSANKTLALKTLILIFRFDKKFLQSNVESLKELANHDLSKEARGEIYYILAISGQVSCAYTHLKKSYEILKKGVDNILLAEVCIALGDSKIAQRKMENSAIMYHNALKALTNEYSPLLKAKAYIGLGNAARGDSQYLWFKLALNILEQVPDNLLKIRAYLGLANRFCAIEQNFRAKEMLKIVFEIEPKNRFAKSIAKRCENYPKKNKDDYPAPYINNDIKNYYPFS